MNEQTEEASVDLVSEGDCVVQVDSPIQFPSMCCKCGEASDQAVRLKPIDLDRSDGTALVAMAVPGLGVFRELARHMGRIEAPLCGKCKGELKRITYGPVLKAFLMIVGMVLAAVFFGRALDIWIMPLSLGVFITAMVMVIRADKRRRQYLPITVYQEAKQLLYVLSGGPYPDLIRKARSGDLPQDEE